MKLEQFKTERFELGDHAVYGGLVGEAARQQRISALGLRVEGRERAQQLRSEMTANAYLVDVLPVAVLAGHRGPF